MWKTISFILAVSITFNSLANAQFGDIAKPDTIEPDLLLRQNFQQFTNSFLETRKVNRLDADKLIELCRRIIGQSGINDPTRVANAIDLGIAVACQIDQFSTAIELATRNQEWCKENNFPKNSHHLQTVTAKLEALKTVSKLPKEQQAIFAETLLRKSHFLLALQTGTVTEQQSISECVEQLKTAEVDFKDVLGDANWYSFESGYLANRNSPVSEQWKVKTEKLIAQASGMEQLLANHILVAKMRISLAKYNARRGRVAAGLKLLQTVTQADQDLGTPKTNSGDVVAAQAEIEQLSGNPKQAYLTCKKIVEQFQEIELEQLSVRDCEHRAETIGKLATFEAGLGMLQGAVAKLESTALLWQKVAKFTPSRKTSLRSAENLLRLASLRIQTKNRSQAAIDAAQALKVLAKHFPKESVFYRHHAMVAGSVFANSGEVDRARAMVLAAIEDFKIDNELQSPPSLVHFLQNAVSVLRTSNDHEIALRLINETRTAIEQSNLPEQSSKQLFAAIDQITAVVALRRGNRSVSFDLTEKEILNKLPTLRSELLQFDEAETLVAASKLHSATLMLLAATEPNESDQIERAWNALMQTKRVGSCLLASRDQAIVKFDKELGKRYLDLRSALSLAAYYGRHESLPKAEYQLSNWEHKKKAFFSEIPDVFKSKILKQSFIIDSYDDVANQLGTDEAYVDIVRNSRLRINGDRQYQAFVVWRDNNGKVAAKLVSLGDVNKIDNWVSAWRSQFIVVGSRDVTRKTKPKIQDFNSAGKQLFTRVWKPIEDAFGQKKTIAICGDGALSQLPWSTLPNGKQLVTSANKTVPGRLVDDYQIVDVVAFKMLAETMAENFESDSVGASIFVDIDYGKTNVSTTLAQTSSLPVWTDLGESLEERSAFQTCFGKSNCKLFTGPQATKRNMLEAAANSQILHLSTHGYYLPSGASETTFFDQLNQSTNFYRRNPWISSGLVFAGANTRKSSPDLVNESTLLSGEEIACRTLNGVDLVVLATCKSGEGEVLSGEGAFGMQQAFVLAGAKSAIGSYWAVSDSKTNLFMQRFYKAFGEQVSVSEALHQAQKSFRRDDYDARHWGAWMVTGNWKVTK